LLRKAAAERPPAQLLTAVAQELERLASHYREHAKPFLARAMRLRRRLWPGRPRAAGYPRRGYRAPLDAPRHVVGEPMHKLVAMLLGWVPLILAFAVPAFSSDLETRVSVLESRPRPVLVDSNGQEVGPMAEGGVIIESDGAFLNPGADRQGWHSGTTFHLAADCSDAPSWLKDSTDPLANSGTLYDFSAVNTNHDLFAVDSASGPLLIWDPVEQGSAPRVYRASSGSCAEEQFLSSAFNRQLTWYLIPLRFVVNLNEAYPPPLHVELRSSGEAAPVQAGCGLGPELALLMPPLWWLTARARRNAGAARSAAQPT